MLNHCSGCTVHQNFGFEVFKKVLNTMIPGSSKKCSAFAEAPSQCTACTHGKSHFEVYLLKSTNNLSISRRSQSSIAVHVLLHFNTASSEMEDSI